MNDIYVIFGSTGEYSDHIEWVFGYTKSKRRAEKIVNFLNENLKSLNIYSGENYQHNSESCIGDERRKAKEHMKKFDEFFDVDYTGSCYTFAPVKEANIKI